MALVSSLSIGAAVEGLVQMAYTLRVELLFFLVFGLVYYAGRLSRAKPTPGKAAAARKAGSVAPSSSAKSTQHSDGAAKAQLHGPARLLADVVQLCHRPTGFARALKAYRAARQGGLTLGELAVGDCQQLFAALVPAAIQAGRTEDALQLLREMRAEGPGASAGLLTSIAKLLTSKQHFAECLTACDGGAGGALPEADSSLWSCLLFCAVEEKRYDRCTVFFDRLKAVGKPSDKDYSNMIRFASAKGDARLTLQLVQEMRAAGVDIDNIVYNTALATLIAADQLDQANSFLEEMEAVAGAADVIAYNTLAKGFARAGRMDRCSALIERMRGRGIMPSQVSYGILLDGYINAKQVDRAAEVYDGMLRDGCSMNTVLYTTLIKGFARAGEVEQAMRVYGQMRADPGAKPDLITFGILIKANCDCQRLDAALQLFGLMPELQLRPDEIIYNNLIGGCVAEARAEVAKELYRQMVASGVRPSSATFSILIRLYTQCKLIDEAFEMLKSEPIAHGMSPEPRLFLQLINSCLRDRLGRRAVDAYALMLKHAKPTAANNSSVLGLCIKLNMLETAAELLGLIAEAKGCVPAADADALLEACRRKQKGNCAEACRAALRSLGLEPAGRERVSRLREG